MPIDFEAMMQFLKDLVKTHPCRNTRRSVQPSWP